VTIDFFYILNLKQRV